MIETHEGKRKEATSFCEQKEAKKLFLPSAGALAAACVGGVAGGCFEGDGLPRRLRRLAMTGIVGCWRSKGTTPFNKSFLLLFFKKEALSF